MRGQLRAFILTSIISLALVSPINVWTYLWITRGMPPYLLGAVRQLVSNALEEEPQESWLDRDGLERISLRRFLRKRVKGTHYLGVALSL